MFSSYKAPAQLAIVKGVNGYEKPAYMLSNYVTDMAKWGHTHPLNAGVFFAQRPRSPPWPSGIWPLGFVHG